MKENEFDYIIDKIKNAKFINEPFPHLEINDFLKESHLRLILNDEQIHFKEVSTDDQLYRALIRHGYSIQAFPGCVSTWSSYKQYLREGKYRSRKGNPVESAGITFRLKKCRNPFINKLLAFMQSRKFEESLRNKFQIDKKTHILTEIQKYLTGYEISPHPDVRRKALTYLLNINKNTSIDDYDVHTHLLEFKDEFKKTMQFWDRRKNTERCWVPWNWCKTKKIIRKNNTIVIFKPRSNPPTLHGIKLDYDHKKFQRTQIYGNLRYAYLWYDSRRIFETYQTCLPYTWKHLKDDLDKNK